MAQSEIDRLKCMAHKLKVREKIKHHEALDRVVAKRKSNPLDAIGKTFNTSVRCLDGEDKR